jgi:hypothetical protein
MVDKAAALWLWILAQLHPILWTAGAAGLVPADPALKQGGNIQFMEKIQKSQKANRGTIKANRCSGVSIRVGDPDPDPNWIRIRSSQWIRIRIRNPDPNPDPGGQKLTTKVDKKIKKFHVLKCWMFFFES